MGRRKGIGVILTLVPLSFTPSLGFAVSEWSPNPAQFTLIAVANSPRKYPISFRALLTGVLILLLGGTALVLIGLSTFFGSRNFRDLTHTIAEQTLARVDAEIQILLQRAVEQSKQAGPMLGSWVTATNLAEASESLAGSLSLQPSLARLTYVLEPSGEFVQAERQTNNQIWIRHGVKRDAGTLAVESWLWDGTNRLARYTTTVEPKSILESHGFREARARNRPAWSAAYLWQDPDGATAWAVRYVVPVRAADGEVKAFMGSSLSLAELNSYLLKLDHQVPGYVAIVERTSTSGVIRVLGHPDPNWVGQTVSTNAPLDPVLASYFKSLVADPRFSAGQLSLGDYGREFSNEGTDYLGSYRRLERQDDPNGWILLMMMPLSEVASGVEQNLRWAGAVAIAFLLIALIAAFALARRIAEPMRQLSRDARALSQLQFDTRPRVLSSIREVRQLEQSLDDARTSLRSFRKYVPADLVNSLVTSGAEASLGGQSARLTILFSDVVEFTRLAETLSAQKLVEDLGRYLAEVSTLIQKNQGTVDKFIGDGVMAFWGAPQPNTQHALAACVAAWRLQQKLDALNARWSAEGEAPFPTRIGLNTGTVIVGNIGSDTRMNYTAVGDPVNVASRLESLNRAFGTRILLSEDTRMAAGDTLITRPVARVAVKGSQRGFVVYELLGLDSEPTETAQRLSDLTAAAFLACEQGRWTESLALYQAILAEFPQDGVAAAQCDFIQENAAVSGETEVIRRMTTK